jgi:hypothetical protein
MSRCKYIIADPKRGNEKCYVDTNHQNRVSKRTQIKKKKNNNNTNHVHWLRELSVNAASRDGVVGSSINICEPHPIYNNPVEYEGAIQVAVNM